MLGCYMYIYRYMRENIYGRRHYRLPNSMCTLFCGYDGRRYAKVSVEQLPQESEAIQGV